MFHSSHPRASSHADRAATIRPVQAAAVFGALVGLGIGCAYLGGTTARATTVRAQAERLNGATSAGFTEEALAAAAGGLDASALTIARRHDPYTVAGSARRDRQAELLTARLEQLRPDNRRSDLRRASLTNMAVAARPFRIDNALDASRDLECLTQAAYYEARGEGRDGMQAVVQVVLNRARHSAFPNSVCGVVYQGSGRRVGCQFSFTCDGSMRGRVNRAAWDRARNVASAALSGSVYASVGNATFFHTTGVSPRWRTSMQRVSQVGTHIFYRFGGRAGSSNAFSYTAQASSGAEMQRAVYAGVDPATTVRQAGQAIAYTALLAQEGLTEVVPPAASAAKPAVAQAPVVQAPAAAQAVTPAPARVTPAPAPAPVAAKPAQQDTVAVVTPTA
ncbi:MAG: cell wall hydrolase [Alphaproteobacteria bacterium]|nr:cell wall hydrolase [Alphaproteobacteria bacterium]MBU2380609.1 cell wall hydrolase [Alphaproteobacteria bacterium]